jgi:hypothetical protein
MARSVVVPPRKGKIRTGAVQRNTGKVYIREEGERINEGSAIYEEMDKYKKRNTSAH